MYYGQIVWLKNLLDNDYKSKVGINNPDQNKRSTTLIVLRMLLGIEYVMELFTIKKTLKQPVVRRNW